MCAQRSKLQRTPSKVEEFGNTFRKKQFHSSFEDLPKDEEIYQHYNCALTGEGVASQKGRLYLTTHYLAFTSSLFGKTSRQVLKWDDVVGIRRDDPDISVKTTQSQVFIFGSFADLEGAWDNIKDAWHRSLSNDDGSISGTPQSPVVHDTSTLRDVAESAGEGNATKNRIERGNIRLSDDEEDSSKGRSPSPLIEQEDSDSEEEITYQDLMAKVSSTKKQLKEEQAATTDTSSTTTTSDSTPSSNAATPTTSTSATPTPTTTNPQPTSGGNDKGEQSLLQQHIEKTKKEREEEKAAARHMLRATPIVPLPTTTTTTTSTTTAENGNTMLLVSLGIVGVAVIAFLALRSRRS